MVLGTATEKTDPVNGASAKDPDSLWKFLAGCDVPVPADAGNDRVIMHWVSYTCRHARVGLYRRGTVGPMEGGL